MREIFFAVLVGISLLLLNSTSNAQKTLGQLDLAIQQINKLSTSTCIVSRSCAHEIFNNMCCNTEICCNLFAYLIQNK